MEADINERLRGAASRLEVEKIRELLGKGANVNAPDPETGWTALMLAAISQMLQPTIIPTGNLTGEQSLNSAKEQGLFEEHEEKVEQTIRELLNAGADANTRDKNGRTAFYWWQTKQGQGYSETFFQKISNLLIHASVSAIVKEELKSTRVSKVNIREDESSYDSEPLYRIEIIFEGKRLNPDNVNKMLLRVRDCLLDIDDERFPLITFVSDTGKRKAS